MKPIHALKNTWYQAGWSHEVTADEALARTILDEPIFFYRTSEGKIAALFDRCPHRFAPLSAGCVDGDTVVCGYHGLAFDGNGDCTHNPHGDIPPRLRVKSFPVEERHTAIWIWMGEPALADPASIPDLSFIDNVPPETRITGYMYTECDYQLLADNIMDLSHADFLHPETLGGMMISSETTVWSDDDKIKVRWLAENCVAPAAFVPMADENNRVDICIEVAWQPPALMLLYNTGVKPGVEVTEDDLATTLHNMVPETSGRTHYFYCSTRRFLLESPEFTEMLRAATLRAFRDEDKPMLEKQQRSIGDNDFWELSPALLPIDKAAVQARRRLDKMIREEGDAEKA